MNSCRNGEAQLFTYFHRLYKFSLHSKVYKFVEKHGILIIGIIGIVITA